MAVMRCLRKVSRTKQHRCQSIDLPDTWHLTYLKAHFEWLRVLGNAQSIRLYSYRVVPALFLFFTIHDRRIQFWPIAYGKGFLNQMQISPLPCNNPTLVSSELFRRNLYAQVGWSRTPNNGTPVSECHISKTSLTPHSVARCGDSSKCCSTREHAYANLRFA